MRRALTVGTPVKIVKTPTWYKDTLDVAKKLGSTDVLNLKEPKVGDEGELVGVEDGYCLVKFSSYEALLDMDCLDKMKRKEDIKILVKYPNDSIQEFSDEKEVESRIRELYARGHLKIGDEIKSYQISEVKSIKVKVEISFI